MTYFSKKGFGTYLETGKYSDLVLEGLEGQKYQVHRIILCHRSDYFRKLITGGFRETNSSEIQLREPDPCEVFPFLLEWIYTGKTSIDQNTSVPLLRLADFYGVSDLYELAKDFVWKNVSKDNVCIMMHSSLLCESQETAELCKDVLAKNLTLIENPEIGFIDYDLFTAILSHPYLRVTSEYDLFTVIITYLRTCEEELTSTQKMKLFEKIGFREMSIEQLKLCHTIPEVPKQLLIDALMFALKQEECPNMPEYRPSAVSYNKKRISCSTFRYFGEDFDNKGIVYFIATKEGSAPWENPHNTGDIVVSASSIAKGTITSLVALQPTELWTKDQPSSWFIIDFGETKTVRPTHYSLRHGGNYKSDCLRQWDFGASNDKKNWVLLSHHSKDETLSTKFAAHTWPVKDTATSFRYFRILQTGRNSANHNFLALSGFELYGDLFQQGTPFDSD